MVGLNVFCYQELGQPQFMATERLYLMTNNSSASERCYAASTSNWGDQCCWGHTHTSPSSHCAISLCKCCLYLPLQIPLFLCSIVSTPVTLCVPTHCTPKMAPINHSQTSAFQIHWWVPSLSYSACQQDLTQLLLPSSLKSFPSLGFLEATLGALPSQRVLLASLLCWILLASLQPLLIQVPQFSYHFSICPHSQSQINLLAFNTT